MIGSLRGTLVGTIRGSVVVEVDGVGYRVAMTADTLTSLAEGQEVFVWTHLAVRENSQDLYGFLHKEELQWFELLLTVSGIGPKSALNIMNAADTGVLKSAVSHNDAGVLVGAGVGKKTAEKIVLELREKVGPSTGSGQDASQGSDSDVVGALIGLGYSMREAREAARAVPKAATTTEEKIREAIRIASRSV